MRGTRRALPAHAFGWKYVNANGFTFVVQGGASYVAVRAENSMSSKEQKRFYPLLNLNLGWSF